jgi:1-acyl-sn-glycerol-3-phosphate acyltransferase
MKVGSILVYKLAVAASNLYFVLNGGIKAVNPENVPAKGGVIVAAIHLTAVDPTALACTMPHRRLLAMAKEELWKNKAFGWLIGKIGAFPVKRGEGDTESIRMSIAVLGAGHALLIFPEGTRGDGKTLLPMNRGVAMLAKKTGVPVTPAGIVGTRPKRRGVIVAYGKPFTYAEAATGKNERENRDLFLRRLEDEIARLCTENGLPIRTASSYSGQSEAARPPQQAEDQNAC